MRYSRRPRASSLESRTSQPSSTRVDASTATVASGSPCRHPHPELARRRLNETAPNVPYAYSDCTGSIFSHDQGRRQRLGVADDEVVVQPLGVELDSVMNAALGRSNHLAVPGDQAGFARVACQEDGHAAHRVGLVDEEGVGVDLFVAIPCGATAND